MEILARLTQLDIPDRLSPIMHPVAAQLLFAVFCSAVAIAVRFLTDFWLPGAGPFALTVPAVLVATLFGRWLCGAITQTISSIYAWYFVLPVQGSFEFLTTQDGPRVVVNMAAGFFVVALAEMFRRAVQRALADRDMLMMELEHRVKNNFASISSILRLQQRNAPEEETKAALQTALGRVEQFARAHNHLYRDFNKAGTVNMRAYLGELCSTLSNSLGEGARIRIDSDISAVQMPRDRAITLGLLVNEVVTNSVKHAFTGRKEGRVEVRFSESPEAYLLTVSDNGRGMDGERRSGSLGLNLIEALVRQANGTVETVSSDSGTVVRFEFVL
jgi:two-component sensor histidine kinase